MEATRKAELRTGAATETLFRSCPVCEASCGLAIDVDRTANRVVAVRGDPDDHRSQGYVCAKSQVVRHVLEDPARLRRPQLRTADGWKEIGWQEALDLAGSRLAAIRAEHGKDAIALYYGNPNGHNFATQIYTQLFISMLDTERFFSAGSVDQQPKNLSNEILYGNAWLFPIPDLERTDFFVCMGGNPLVSQGSLMSAPDAGRRFAELRERGGKLVVIDPRRTETAALADRHLFVRPGTDAFLLFALVNLLFTTARVQLAHLEAHVEGLQRLRELAEPFTPEAVADVTGIAAADIHWLCDAICAAERPVIYGRIGLCTQAFGTLASWLVDVVNLLRGRLDTEGGAMFPRAATGHLEDPTPAPPLARARWHSKVRGFPEYMSMLPATTMAEELAWDGPGRARALITVAGNPVLSVPNGDRLRDAIKGLDFVVALDIYNNETTGCADLILPSTTQLEHSNFDFLFQTTAIRNFARWSPRVLEPEAGAMDQWQLLLEIAARLHGTDAATVDAMMLDGMAARVAAGVPGLDAQAVKQVISAHAGPERLLDAMLRAGPYGAGFADDEGLDLQSLMNAEHGVDLGPLQPNRLPGILRTPGQRIPLLHPLFEQDIERLRAALGNGAPEGLLLIGRRHIRDMNSWLHNLPHYVRGKDRCTLRMHPGDAASRGVADGGDAIIRSAVAERRVTIELSDEMMPGVVSLPHGFGHRHSDTGQPVAQAHAGVSCNDLVGDGLDLPSGTSIVNGVPVEVRALQA